MPQSQVVSIERVFSNRYEFTYLFVAIAVTFLGLGYVLGRQADTLRRLSSTDRCELPTRRCMPRRLEVAIR